MQIIYSHDYGFAIDERSCGISPNPSSCRMQKGSILLIGMRTWKVNRDKRFQAVTHKTLNYRWIHKEL